jgi:hypothetical protein
MLRLSALFRFSGCGGGTVGSDAVICDQGACSSIGRCGRGQHNRAVADLDFQMIRPPTLGVLHGHWNDRGADILVADMADGGLSERETDTDTRTEAGTAAAESEAAYTDAQRRRRPAT